MIFESDRVKKMLLLVLREAKKRFIFQIENLCIMGNHVHLIIRPGCGESLSEIMQWVLGVFAMRFNRLHHCTGHVWGERFFSRIVDTMRAYLEISSYIDANPFIAGLVVRVEDWLYSRFHLRSIGFGDLISAPPSCSDWS
jgi:putative transposase